MDIIKVKIETPKSAIPIKFEIYKRSEEAFEVSQNKELLREYIKSHAKDITRRMDVLVLYIGSFRKIFEKNIGLVNQDAIKYIESQFSAVKQRQSYITEYLYSIKEAFQKAANNMIIIKQDSITLSEINLEEFDRHTDEIFLQVSNELIRTAEDLSSIGRAFGKPYIISSFNNKEYEKKKAEFDDLGNIQDRYLIDIGFIDGIGYAKLSIVSFFKIG